VQHWFDPGLLLKNARRLGKTQSALF
jgi:hypothetical protein